MKAPLREYFEADEKDTLWELWCKRCKRGWRLAKPQEGAVIHGGNLLHLVNHAMSHKENRDKAFRTSKPGQRLASDFSELQTTILSQLQRLERGDESV